MESKSYKMHVRVLLSRYRAYTKCPDCDGQRLNKDAQLFLLNVGQASRLSPSSTSKKADTGATPVLLSLADFYALPVRDALTLVEQLSVTESAITNRQSPIEMALD